MIALYTYIYHGSSLKDSYYLHMAFSDCNIQGRFLMERMKCSLEKLLFHCPVKTFTPSQAKRLDQVKTLIYNVVDHQQWTLHCM